MHCNIQGIVFRSTSSGVSECGLLQYKKSTNAEIRLAGYNSLIFNDCASGAPHDRSPTNFEMKAERKKEEDKSRRRRKKKEERGEERRRRRKKRKKREERMKRRPSTTQVHTNNCEHVRGRSVANTGGVIALHAISKCVFHIRPQPLNTRR